jgi:hypothetical protein
MSAGTTPSADAPGGRTGTSTTCSWSTATCRPRCAAQLPAHDRRRRKQGRRARPRMGIQRRVPRPTHHQCDAAPTSLSGMPQGLHRRLPIARRKRSQRRSGRRSRRSSSRRRGCGGLSTGRCWQSSPATPRTRQTRRACHSRSRTYWPGQVVRRVERQEECLAANWYSTSATSTRTSSRM